LRAFRKLRTDVRFRYILLEGTIMTRVKGFEAYEDIGIGIPNPRSVHRWPIPEGLSPEQLAAIEAEIDRINAEEEAKGIQERVASLLEELAGEPVTVKEGQLWLYQRTRPKERAWGVDPGVAHWIDKVGATIESTAVTVDCRYRDGQKVTKGFILAAEGVVDRVTQEMLSGRDAFGTWKLLEESEEWMEIWTPVG
jgi:hypothetical protein